MAKVSWTLEAQRWLEDIFEFITAENPEAALRTVLGIYEAQATGQRTLWMMRPSNPNGRSTPAQQEPLYRFDSFRVRDTPQTIRRGYCAKFMRPIWKAPTTAMKPACIAVYLHHCLMPELPSFPGLEIF